MTMKRSFFILMVILAAALVAQPAHAKRVQPIQNVENSPIPDGLSMKDIHSAIVLAGSIRNWAVTKVEDGHLQATLHLRSHMAKVDIHYDQDSYSITYNSSDNLKYKNGRIHRNYNSWVSNLNGDIQVVLANAVAD